MARKNFTPDEILEMHRCLEECAAKGYLLTTSQLANILGLTPLALRNWKVKENGIHDTLGYRFQCDPSQRRTEWSVTIRRPGLFNRDE